ncbi:hypothetical protein BV898_18377 [Hypsibius exemplaris]|uniref:Uncharacterized protein n=1 Tax=Hypsibius exemplaris TaxID=2072580 RepID=A0A9X6NJ82_HYPEX|nr:hypothetical protein BV898_18377 [Hypsibius exemplaris]
MTKPLLTNPKSIATNDVPNTGAGGRFCALASSAATGPASFEYFAVFRMNRNGLCNMVVRSGYAVGVLAFNTYVPLCLVTIAALVVSRQLIYKSLVRSQVGANPCPQRRPIVDCQLDFAKRIVERRSRACWFCLSP